MHAPVTPTAARHRWLPADYVTNHLELAYATTAHGAQGDTVTTAHTVIGEHTGAASAYVGMTRGRQANTAHLVAADADQARELWAAVFARDRADLGPAHAAQQAAAEADRYASPRPLDDVLAELRAAWTDERRCEDLVTGEHLRREALRATVALHAESTQRLGALERNCAKAATDAAIARQRADASGALVTADTTRMRAALLDHWNSDRETARHAAQVILAGPGRFGFGRGAVARATEQLNGWHATWAPHLPGLPADNARLTRLVAGDDDRPAMEEALHAAARRAAERAHPEHAELTAAADAAGRSHYAARGDLDRGRRDHHNRYGPPGQADYAAQLANTQRTLADARQQLADIRARIARLQAEPALLAQPERLQQEGHAWRARRDAAESADRTALRPTVESDRVVRGPRPEDLRYLAPHRGPGRGIGR